MLRYRLWMSCSVLSALFLCFLEVPTHADPCARDAGCLRLVRMGISQYQQQQYEQALVSFRRAYVRRRVPGLLINIGRTLHQLNRPAEAIALFERYLSEQPESPHKEQVQRFHKEALARIGQATASAPEGQAGTTERPATAEAGSSTQPPEASRALLPTGIHDPPDPTLYDPAPAGPVTASQEPQLSLSTPEAQVTHAKPQRFIRKAWVIVGGIALGLGGAGLLTGVSCYAVELSAKDKLSQTNNEFEKLAILGSAQTLNTTSLVGYAVGSALLVTGAAALIYELNPTLRKRLAHRRVAINLSGHAIELTIGGTY